MHPVIKEYWEKYHGREVTLNETGQFYEVKTDENGCFIIAMKYLAVKILDSNGKVIRESSLPHLKDDDWVYPFAGHLNDEVRMLRLLNLRAFL